MNEKDSGRLESVHLQCLYSLLHSQLLHPSPPNHSLNCLPLHLHPTPLIPHLSFTPYLTPIPLPLPSPVQMFNSSVTLEKGSEGLGRSPRRSTSPSSIRRSEDESLFIFCDRELRSSPPAETEERGEGPTNSASCTVEQKGKGR